MAKKEKKFKLDNLLGTVKKGKEFWDAHGAELTEAVKKVIPQKGKKVSVSNIMGAVKAGQSAWADSGKEVVSAAAGLLSGSPESANDVENDIVEEVFPEEDIIEEGDSNDDMAEEPEYLPETDTLTQVSNETIKYVAEQETKREEIRAERDVAIERIHAMSDNIKLYLEKTFDERSAIFAKQFECVDAALRDGNTEMLALTLNSINSLAASSPFKNLADINQVQQALGDSSTEWDI